MSSTQHVPVTLGASAIAVSAGVLQGLTPIRTRSWKDDNASFSDSDASAAQQRSGPLHKALASAADALRHLSDALVRPHCCATPVVPAHPCWKRCSVLPGKLPPSTGRDVQDVAGYWRTQKEVVADVWAVVNGPERRAVRLALMIAFLDQGMASTAIVNYAPQARPDMHPVATARHAPLTDLLCGLV